MKGKDITRELILPDSREELIAALKDTIRMLDAVRYSAGLGKGRAARLEKARALLDKAERG